MSAHTEALIQQALDLYKGDVVGLLRGLLEHSQQSPTPLDPELEQTIKNWLLEWDVVIGQGNSGEGKQDRTAAD
jgi:hypothetical protein